MALLNPPVTVRGPKTERRRALDVARLLESVAEQIQACVEHLNHERNIVNAWPASTAMGEGGKSKGSVSRPVESAVCAVDTIEDHLRQIGFDLVGIESYAASILRIVHKSLMIRTPDDNKPRCWAGELAGYELARIDGGWSFPDCTGYPRSGDSGPCARCYQAHIRYRARVNLPPLRSLHPAA